VRRHVVYGLASQIISRASASAKRLVRRAIDIRLKPRCGINVAVYSNWDVDAAIKYLTPRGTGRWGPVRFLTGKKITRPDFVLILNSPSQDQLEITAPPERIWFASGEPPDFKPYHLGQGRGTVVVTCDASVASNPTRDREFVLEPPILRTWQVQRSIEELAAIRSIKKTKVLSWVTSSKDALPGHQLRLFFLRTIWHKLPLDLYGRNFTPLDDKWDGIAPYRYSIAFENARSPHYFSEKIMDCFVCLTLPLYYGSPEIEKYFPAKSFIAIEPTDPRTVDKIRDIIAADLWKEREEALQEAKWLVLYKYNMFSQLSRLMLERLRPAGTPETLQIKRVVCDYG
jgi:Glycosyltransferase family 10 (fucosyltransferase) C-term